MFFGDKFDKILILTNPITWFCFIVVVILGGGQWIIKHSQINNLFFIWFGLKNQSKENLKGIIKWSTKMQKGKGSKWGKYVHKLAVRRANELL